MKNTMLAGILSGGEGGPGWRRDWGQNRLELPRGAFTHKLSQIWHVTFCHPRFREVPRGGVQSHDHDFWTLHNFLCVRGYSISQFLFLAQSWRLHAGNRSLRSMGRVLASDFETKP